MTKCQWATKASNPETLPSLALDATPEKNVGTLSADAELDKSMQEKDSPRPPADAESSPQKHPGSCSDKEEADAARLEGHTSNKSIVPTELADEPPSADSLSAASVALLAQAGTIHV